LEKKLGQEISIDNIYGLVHRHPWRKLTPRPHRAKQDPAIVGVFKKNFRKRSKLLGAAALAAYSRQSVGPRICLRLRGRVPRRRSNVFHDFALGRYPLDEHLSGANRGPVSPRTLRHVSGWSR
jgi:hypothetical protein